MSTAPINNPPDFQCDSGVDKGVEVAISMLEGEGIGIGEV